MTRAMPDFSDNAKTVLERRYLKKNEKGEVLETPQELLARVAATIAEADLKYDEGADVAKTAEAFYDMMASREFLPNSPTLMNAGRDLGQLSACFVLPVGDSMESIFDAVKNTALIHKSGGGTGFSFSSVRPKNDIVCSTNGVSSGPISFMKVFDTATEMIKQGGTRRGANMGMLRVDHPDIEEFVGVKQDKSLLTNFNLSVALTDTFMEAVNADDSYALISPRNGEVVKKLNARDVFDQLVQAAWASGEPGIVFIDRMNRDNPTPNVGEIEATNPCGEQPLLPYESCNLGSINLALMEKDGEVDWARLGDTIKKAVHFLDNVVDVNRYPLKQIEEMTLSNRKIGMGIMGWADLLYKLCIPYGSEESLRLAEKLMKFVDDTALEASLQLAKVRGAFPNFKGSVYNSNGSKEVRNATRTTIAPTGTISILAGCSSGIEPLFSLAFIRRVMDGTEMLEINPVFEDAAKAGGFYKADLMNRLAKGAHLADLEGVPEEAVTLFVTAHEINPEQHIKMQAAFQDHTNNAVSKTVNFPETATSEEVAEVFWLAYKMGCKGVTIYRDKSREGQVLNVGEDKKPAEQVRIEAAKPQKRDRPAVLVGKTYQMRTGCGPLYITINEDNDGLFEVFTTMGKAGGCAASQCEALGRLVSLSWRMGVDVEAVIKNLRGISCHKPSGFGANRVLSCADALASAVQSHYNPNAPVKNGPSQVGACPECGDAVEHEEGCLLCRSCGYSECG
ncbi:MAG: ribonucleoside-diphosphate reductase, adenosylcobalamin-dependent [Deltaproteobacteria bacterium]|nr:MAG: ribonucleoside-diphosphate reductase, adenosylcobalamin-dependent [Deltaproteobacteria bacterium]